MSFTKQDVKRELCQDVFEQYKQFEEDIHKEDYVSAERHLWYVRNVLFKQFMEEIQKIVKE